MSGISRPSTALRSVLILPVAVAGLLAAQPAAAQQGDELTEILVTVRQRAESIQDVPGSVAAFSAEHIERTGIQRAADFVQQTPGVSIVNAAEVGDSQVNIRGINGARDAETNYALIIDGVLMTNPAALNREYTNLQQIEILKGPQGALYGRNAAAGAIVITTEKPGDTWGGKVRGSVAQDDTYVVTGNIGGPVSDTLRVGLTGSFRDSDGYYRNAYYDTQVPGSDSAIVDYFESWDISGRVIWEPTEALTIDSKLRYGEVDAGSISFNSVFHLPGLVGLLEAGFGLPPEFAAFADENVNDHRFQFDNNIKPFNNQEALEFSVKADYDLGWADLTAWGLYSDIENDLGADGTSGAFGFFFAEQECIDTTNELSFYPVAPPQLIVGQDAFGPGTGGPAGSIYGAYTPTACDGTQYQVRNQEDLSFEIRLASKGDQRLRWLVGAYYLDLEREVGVNTGLDRGFGVFPTLFTTDVRNPTEQLVHDRFDTEVYAVFGQLAYDLTDDIEASLALRYDREKRKVTNLVPADAITEYINTCDPFGGNTGGDPINPGFCGGASIDPKSETFDELQPKLSLTWDAMDNLTAYATVGVGFKSGGFNNQGSAATIDGFLNAVLLYGPGTDPADPSTWTGPFAPGNAGGYGPGFDGFADGFPAVNIQDQYDEETSIAYEMGIKSRWLDNRLRTELAVYHVEVDDMQFFEFVVGGFGLLRVVSNIDEVELTGAEISATFNVTDWFDVYGGFNITDSEIKKNSARPDSVGNKSPYTPDYTWNAGAQVTFPMTSALDFIANVDVNGVGKTWFHVIQDQERPTGFSAGFGIAPGEYSKTRRDAYALVNLRAGVAAERWSLVGFVSNALDERYLEEVIPAPEFGGTFNHPGTERRVGVEATLKF